MHLPVVTVQAVQVDEHDVQVVAVPPSEYVIDPHALHFPFSNLYPSLHVVQTPVDVEQAVHPVQAVQELVVPPVEYVNDPQAVHFPLPKI